MFDAYLRYEYYFASAQLVFAMFGMGATLHVKDFVEVLRYPRGFLMGIATVLVASPLLAVVISRGFDLEPGIATGLLLVAAVPGGTMSNILTYFARGNVPLSISMTGVCTLTCLVSTPLVLRVFATGAQDASYEMPVFRISAEILFFLLVPLGLGMATGARHEAQRDRISKLSIRASLAVIVMMIIGSTGAGRVQADAYGMEVIAALYLFAIGLLLIGIAGTRLMGLPRKDGYTVGIEAAYRNTSLALLVKASLFPAVPGVPDPFADQVFFVALLYAGFALPVVLPVIFLGRRGV